MAGKKRALTDSVSDIKLRIVVDEPAIGGGDDNGGNSDDEEKSASISLTNTSPVYCKAAKFNEHRLQSLSASNKVMLNCRCFDLST